MVLYTQNSIFPSPCISSQCPMFPVAYCMFPESYIPMALCFLGPMFPNNPILPGYYIQMALYSLHLYLNGAIFPAFCIFMALCLYSYIIPNVLYYQWPTVSFQSHICLWPYVAKFLASFPTPYVLTAVYSHCHHTDCVFPSPHVCLEFQWLYIPGILSIFYYNLIFPLP